METKTISTSKTTTLFVNLFAAIKAEKMQRLNEFTASIKEENDVWVMLDKWQYKDLLTASKKRVIWALTDLQDYLISRKAKAIQKEIDKELQHLLTVEKAGELTGMKISVEWKKSRMWGSNPTCEAWIAVKGDSNYYNSGSIGGCGYDKLSTAIANAVNQDNAFLKAMYLLKEANPTANNHALFGYGSGYGILPRLEGGVGVSCYPAIFDKIGFVWSNTAWGKTYDVFAVAKK